MAITQAAVSTASSILSTVATDITTSIDHRMYQNMLAQRSADALRQQMIRGTEKFDPDYALLQAPVGVGRDSFSSFLNKKLLLL